MSQVAGTDEAAIERLAITDPQISVAKDLDRLRAALTLPDELVVADFVAPASLRKGDGS